MNCRHILSRLSGYLDGDLSGEASRHVSAHLESCPRCAEAWRVLRESLEALADLPRLDSPEPLAVRVFDRLEVESRSPSLALLFRPAWQARPLIVASLLPAAFVFVLALGAAVLIDRVPKAIYAAMAGDTRPGSESNPVFPSRGVSVPRLSGPALPEDLAQMGEGTLFFQTVVARDGSVSAVTLLDGDESQASPLMDALRRERFEPGRYRGRPVAVSLYRLISRLEVRPPTT